MKLQPNLFFKELLLFVATLVLGLFVAYKYSPSLSGLATSVSALSLSEVMFFLVAVFIVWILSHAPSLMKWIFWAFLSLVIFSGAQIVLAIITPSPWDVVGSIVLLFIFFSIRNVAIHDLAVIIAIAGAGAIIGISITPLLAIVLCVLLSFYDIIAVYKTHHMVRIAESMISSGAIFGFIVPTNFQNFFSHRGKAQSRIGHDFMILGSGDIGLPVIFASSVLRDSVPQGIIVAIFAVLGLLATHVLFVSQTKRKPMAALPPIATMTLIGYAVALLII